MPAPAPGHDLRSEVAVGLGRVHDHVGDLWLAQPEVRARRSHVGVDLEGRGDRS